MSNDFHKLTEEVWLQPSKARVHELARTALDSLFSDDDSYELLMKYILKVIHHTYPNIKDQDWIDELMDNMWHDAIDHVYKP